MKRFLIEVVAGLTVVAISAVAGTIWQGRKDQERLDAAPRVYVEQLDRLIQQGVQEGEDKAILNARAIVAARNSLANSLIAISVQLDSEIDRLADELGEPKLKGGGLSGPGSGNREADKKAAYQTILVLQKIWPAKKVEIEFAVRKQLAEMGLPVSAATAQPTPSDRIGSQTPSLEKSPSFSAPPTPNVRGGSDTINKPRIDSSPMVPTSPLISAPLVDDNAIYSPGQVGVKPQITYQEKPRYTRAANTAGVQGIVRISAILRKDGRVTDIKVVKGLGYGLNEEAINAALQTKFIPGQKDGKPVNVRMTMDYTFTIM